jgi:hypothetical protein
MKLKIIKTLFIFVCLFMQGCTVFVDFEDVSKDKVYAGVINKSYDTNIKFLVHGVNMDETIGKDIHLYTVTPPPGISGREIKSRTTLDVSSRIKVIKILKCTNCYLDFSPRIKFQVKVLSEKSFDDHDVFFRDSWGDMKFLYVENDEAVINSEYFILVD